MSENAPMTSSCAARGEAHVWVSSTGPDLPRGGGVWVQTCMASGCPALRIDGIPRSWLWLLSVTRRLRWWLRRLT